jgi:hypothetical protein
MRTQLCLYKKHPYYLWYPLQLRHRYISWSTIFPLTKLSPEIQFPNGYSPPGFWFQNFNFIIHYFFSWHHSMSARPKVPTAYTFFVFNQNWSSRFVLGNCISKYKRPGKQIETANANHCHCFRYFSENLLNQSHFQNRRRNRYFPCKKIILLL